MRISVDLAIPVLAPIARFLTANQARVAMFHRLSPLPAFRRIPIASFEQRIRYISENYNVVSLFELVRRLQGDESIHKCVAITFDDGHKDFLDCAYEILKKYNVPVTVYLVSDFVNQRTWLWSDAIHWMVSVARAGNYRFQAESVMVDAQIDDQESRNVLWERLADRCLPMTVGDRAQTLDEIARELRVRLPSLPVREYASMTWDDLRSMDPTLVHFGAHPRSHPILSKCTFDEQFDEINQCRATIESELQRNIDAFCYPNGRYSDFNEVTMGILRQSGFRSAVTSEGGLIEADSNPFMLPRIGAGDNPSEFRAQLDGMLHIRKRLRGSNGSALSQISIS
jgi:peptidoglycan/xylan/chitin deacetylase (PgdA/CDA1 family)